MDAEQRLERLRDFASGERGPYDGIASDIVILLDALGVAKLALDLSSPHEKSLIADAEKHRAENAQLRALLGAALADTERMDWLEKTDADLYTKDRWDGANAAVQGGQTYNAKEAPTVREAIDLARK